MSRPGVVLTNRLFGPIFCGSPHEVADAQRQREPDEERDDLCEENEVRPLGDCDDRGGEQEAEERASEEVQDVALGLLRVLVGFRRIVVSSLHRLALALVDSFLDDVHGVDREVRENESTRLVVRVELGVDRVVGCRDHVTFGDQGVEQLFVGFRRLFVIRLPCFHACRNLCQLDIDIDHLGRKDVNLRYLGGLGLGILGLCGRLRVRGRCLGTRCALGLRLCCLGVSRTRSRCCSCCDVGCSGCSSHDLSSLVSPGMVYADAYINAFPRLRPWGSGVACRPTFNS